jgi:hypothetical protein
VEKPTLQGIVEKTPLLSISGRATPREDKQPAASGDSRGASNAIEDLASARRHRDELLARLAEAALKPNGRMH